MQSQLSVLTPRYISEELRIETKARDIEVSMEILNRILSHGGRFRVRHMNKGQQLPIRKVNGVVYQLTRRGVLNRTIGNSRGDYYLVVDGDSIANDWYTLQRELNNYR